MFKWPLNVSNFTWLDRLKICGFFLNPNNRWTQGDYVLEYEKKMARYIGCEYAVFVSSGSTANSILASYTKDILCKGISKDKIVVLPSTTWITSCSPFIREGFTPKFIDINLTDFSMDLDKLENFLIEHKGKNDIACVFITSLLGFYPDIKRIQTLESSFKIKIMLDNCESTLTTYNHKNISSYFTSTTSTYFGHNTCSGTGEGGFVFTNSLEEYEYFLMCRNHGMTRSVSNPDKYRNQKVDARFDFNFLGNNYRNTEIAAFGGLLDFKRLGKYFLSRRYLYYGFSVTLGDKYLLPSLNRFKGQDVPFCLPIIGGDSKLARYVCESSSIEIRPIISGFIGFQKAFNSYFKDENISDFPNSIKLHESGFYIGLHSQVKPKEVLKLCYKLNKL